MAATNTARAPFFSPMSSTFRESLGAAAALHLDVCVSSASQHQSARHVAEAQIKETRAVERRGEGRGGEGGLVRGCGGGWGRCKGEEGGTYLPSTAATTLQLISCSCRARSIRSRRSDLRTRLIINTWEQKEKKRGLHTHKQVIGKRFFILLLFFNTCVCVCVFVPHQTPSCSAAWEEETGSWRAPREDFLLLKKKKCRECTQG